MGWNYRVVRHPEPHGRFSYHLHVAWYPEPGNPKEAHLCPWPARPMADSLDELRQDLERMIAALRLRTLDAPAEEIPQEAAAE